MSPDAEFEQTTATVSIGDELFDLSGRRGIQTIRLRMFILTHWLNLAISPGFTLIMPWLVEKYTELPPLDGIRSMPLTYGYCNRVNCELWMLCRYRITSKTRFDFTIIIDLVRRYCNDEWRLHRRRWANLIWYRWWKNMVNQLSFVWFMIDCWLLKIYRYIVSLVYCLLLFIIDYKKIKIK